MRKIRQLEYKITQLEFRIKELEEKICPCESHKWKLVNTDRHYGYKYTYTYKCEKCLKRKGNSCKRNRGLLRCML